MCCSDTGGELSQGDPSKLRKIPRQTEADSSPRPSAVRCSDCVKNAKKTGAGQAKATKATAATAKAKDAKARKNKVKKVAQKTRATSEGPR